MSQSSLALWSHVLRRLNRNRRSFRYIRQSDPILPVNVSGWVQILDFEEQMPTNYLEEMK